MGREVERSIDLRAPAREVVAVEIVAPVSIRAGTTLRREAEMVITTMVSGLAVTVEETALVPEKEIDPIIIDLVTGPATVPGMVMDSVASTDPVMDDTAAMDTTLIIIIAAMLTDPGSGPRLVV